MEGERRVRVGLLGLGNVGQSVARVLEENSYWIERKLGARLELKKVLVRDPHKQRPVPVDMITTDARDIVAHPKIDIVVELMGGLEPARSLIIQSLQAGQAVVTANKEVIAHAGAEIFQAAQLAFEGSVAGGIPIIEALKEALAANRISCLMGIINGTTNFILSKMAAEGVDFSTALTEAQRLGYAEADPAADLEGHDAARKIAILASIAFETRVSDDAVYRQGIQAVTADDIAYGRELGWTLKLLALARRHSETVEVRVHPTFLPNDHPLASVHGVSNAVFVQGYPVGETMFYGPGAGGDATASAVLADMMMVARRRLSGGKELGCTCFDQFPILPIATVETEYYLRLEAADKPGVMAEIARLFGKNAISLNSVIQKRSIGSDAEIVLVTHRTPEGKLQNTVAALNTLACVKAVRNVIRIERGQG
jgi:homoserine dehydrogenase